jgi:WD40 repeat protein
MPCKVQSEWEIYGIPVLIVKWNGHRAPVSSLAFMPNDKGLVNGSFDPTLNYWHLATLGENQTVATTEDIVTFSHRFEGHIVR